MRLGLYLRLWQGRTRHARIGIKGERELFSRSLTQVDHAIIIG